MNGIHKPLIVQQTVVVAAAVEAFTMERTIIDFYLSSFSLIMCTYKVNGIFLVLISDDWKEMHF